MSLIPVQLQPTRQLYTLLDRGDLKLDASAVVVLYALAASTDPRTSEVWMDHATIGRRTGLKLTAVKGAIDRLELAHHIVPVGHERRGIKRWKLNLPTVDGASTAPVLEPKKAEPFDALDYVASLTEPMAEIAPDRVRDIVRHHLVKSSDKFWLSRVVSRRL